VVLNVLSLVVHLIGNKIIFWRVIFISKSEISFPVTFKCTKTRGLTIGNRSFKKTVVTLWNNPSLTIRKCKTLDIFKKVKLILYFSLTHLNTLCIYSYMYFKITFMQICKFKSVAWITMKTLFIL